MVGKTYGECLKRKIRGYEGGQGGMAQRRYNMAYLAFILRSKLHINGLYDWEGQNEKWDAYRTSGMVRIKGEAIEGSPTYHTILSRPIVTDPSKYPSHTSQQCL